MTVSAHDQLMIELINRSRLDPVGEAARLGFDAAGSWMPDSAMQVVAVNQTLSRAAETHSDWMLATDRFSHTGAGGSDPGQRMAEAGYVFRGNWTWGENIALRATSGTLDVTASVETMHRNLFFSDGHRENMLKSVFSEVGVGVETGTYMGRDAAVTTSNYALTGGPSFVTGVVYDDLDGNDFYSVGEGRAGIRFTLNGQSAESGAAGGYSLQLTGGTPQVLGVTTGAGTVYVGIELGGGNVKLDLVDGQLLQSDRSMALRTGAEDARLLGVTDAVLAGNGGDNALTGNAGDNLIIGGGGDDTIAGGAGADRMTGDVGPTEFDIQAGFVYRLYRATLDREPDEAGLTDWVTQLLNGVATETVAARFVASAEFEASYGSAGPIGFVAQLYRNVLGREGAPEEILSWASKLTQGTSRAEVVLGFSESREFVRDTAEAAAQWTQAGLQENWGDDVFRLYLATLARTPDLLGIDNWTKALAEGSSITAVASGFVLSAEFQAMYGDLGHIGFVAQLYRNVLGREADLEGLENWAARLAQGTDRAEVVVGFSQSREFVRDTADDYSAFRADASWSPLSRDGADVFVFAAGDGADTITDFTPGEDLLDLSGLAVAAASGDMLVSEYATLTAQGVVLDFGGGDRLTLEGLATLDGLDDAILLG